MAINLSPPLINYASEWLLNYPFASISPHVMRTNLRDIKSIDSASNLKYWLKTYTVPTNEYPAINTIFNH